jgi:hypothetical protein
MFQTKVVEKFKKHILCSITFSEKRAVYEMQDYDVINRQRTVPRQKQLTHGRHRNTITIPYDAKPGMRNFSKNLGTTSKF